MILFSGLGLHWSAAGPVAKVAARLLLSHARVLFLPAEGELRAIGARTAVTEAARFLGRAHRVQLQRSLDRLSRRTDRVAR